MVAQKRHPYSNFFKCTHFKWSWNKLHAPNSRNFLNSVFWRSKNHRNSKCFILSSLKLVVIWFDTRMTLLGKLFWAAYVEYVKPDRREDLALKIFQNDYFNACWDLWLLVDFFSLCLGLPSVNNAVEMLCSQNLFPVIYEGKHAVNKN